MIVPHVSTGTAFFLLKQDEAVLAAEQVSTCQLLQIANMASLLKINKHCQIKREQDIAFAALSKGAREADQRLCILREISNKQ